MHTYMDWTLHEKAQPSSSSDRATVSSSRAELRLELLLQEKAWMLAGKSLPVQFGTFAANSIMVPCCVLFQTKKQAKRPKPVAIVSFWRTNRLREKQPAHVQASAEAGAGHGWGEAERPLARWNFVSTPPDQRRTRTTTKTHGKQNNKLQKEEAIT